MCSKVREWTAIFAAATVLAYVSSAAISQMQNYAFWSTDLAVVSVFAAICGALLALINKRAIASMIAASDVWSANMFSDGTVASAAKPPLVRCRKCLLVQGLDAWIIVIGVEKAKGMGSEGQPWRVLILQPQTDRRAGHSLRV